MSPRRQANISIGHSVTIEQSGGYCFVGAWDRWQCRDDNWGSNGRLEVPAPLVTALGGLSPRSLCRAVSAAMWLLTFISLVAALGAVVLIKGVLQPLTCRALGLGSPRGAIARELGPEEWCWVGARDADQATLKKHA
jgi:hypothetical protein